MPPPNTCATPILRRTTHLPSHQFLLQQSAHDYPCHILPVMMFTFISEAHVHKRTAWESRANKVIFEKLPEELTKHLRPFCISKFTLIETGTPSMNFYYFASNVIGKILHKQAKCFIISIVQQSFEVVLIESPCFDGVTNKKLDSLSCLIEELNLKLPCLN